MLFLLQTKLFLPSVCLTSQAGIRSSGVLYKCYSHFYLDPSGSTDRSLIQAEMWSQSAAEAYPFRDFPQSPQVSCLSHYSWPELHLQLMNKLQSYNQMVRWAHGGCGCIQQGKSIATVATCSANGTWSDVTPVHQLDHCRQRYSIQ